MVRMTSYNQLRTETKARAIDIDVDIDRSKNLRGFLTQMQTDLKRSGEAWDGRLLQYSVTERRLFSSGDLIWILSDLPRTISSTENLLL